jgi:hypothetical protein
MEKFDCDRFLFEFKDKILHFIIKEESVDYKLINDATNTRLNHLLKDKSYPLFADCRKIKSITREARERLGEKDGGIGVNAVAMLINSKIQKTIFNFFHSIYKAPVPTRLFTNKEKALEWLRKFI